MEALLEPKAAPAHPAEYVEAAPAIEAAPAGPVRHWDLPSVWGLTARIEWLIADMLPLGGVTLLSAASGTGKTWLAYAIAGAVARGREFLGRKVCQRPVCYLDGENPLAIVKRNLRDLGISETPTLAVWGGWNDPGPPGPQHGDLLQFSATQKPLLIWDSLVEFHPGDEQSATETRKFMKQFRVLAHAGATVLVLHHTGKSEGSKEYRGSSDIKGSVDLAYTLKGQPRHGALDRLTMHCFKSRFDAGQDFGLRFQQGRGFERTEVVNGAQKPSAQTIVASIIAEHPRLNGTQIKDLARAQGVGKNAVDAVLRDWPSQRGRGSARLYVQPEEAQPAQQAA